MEVNYLFLSISILLIGAGLNFFNLGKRFSGLLSSLSVFISSVMLFYLAINILSRQEIYHFELFTLKPLINSSLSLTIDGLSALYLMVIAIVSTSVTIFSWKYLDCYPKVSSQRFYPYLLLLFLSSIFVVSVSDLFFFIISWEAMTLSSWFLVVSEVEKKEAIKRGLEYFITMHVATAFLIIASVTLYSFSSDFSFLAIKEILNSLIYENPYVFNFVVLCFLLVFFTKAGVLPFGAWLPNTYPQAPTSASSFFAGIMSKIAVYAVLRFFLSLIPLSSYTEIWGFIIALFGVISIFVGTTAALTQDEAKRLMSFHAIGQVGYMFLGIGIGFYFIKTNPYLGIVALIGGILHALNNSIYKSLLFLNAGSILYKTGTTDLNKVSGLMKVMPLTALTALIGSLSIAGVPFFNGFVSKLLIFQTSIWTALDKTTIFLIKGLFIVFGIVSIFISAITLASFLKFVNSAFMGKSQHIERKDFKITWHMNIPQLALAFICLLIGLFPILILEPIYISLVDAINLELPPYKDLFSANLFGFAVNLCKDCWVGAWFPIAILLPLTALCLLIFSFEGYAKAPKREVETWYGGKEHSPEEVMYGGHSFYQPFKKLITFEIGGIKFKGFYPEQIPSIKIEFPEKIKKLLTPDEWLYYRLADSFINLTKKMEELYDSLSQKFIVWLIIGIIIVFALLFYLMRDTVWS